VSAWLNRLQQHKAIAIIRAHNANAAWEMALAAAAGGLKLLEIAWNIDYAESLIPKLQQELPDCRIGTGTVLDLAMAERAIASGCKFMFTPHVNSEIIKLCCAANVPIVAGALTPTEILHAWQLGATAIKVFPVKAVGGVEYISCLQPVLGEIPLIPTGGVMLEDVQDYIEAGAVAVGVSSHLFVPEAIAAGDWSTIIARSRFLTQQLH
jgi:2-dehydro-3-deoxyphosphogluconate aldolase/(4S)-4-hydroxy-2-oxoglutarate aldolase